RSRLLKRKRLPYSCLRAIKLRWSGCLHLRDKRREDLLANRMRKFFNNILPARNKFRSLTDQRVRSEALCIRDVSRDRKNLSSELQTKTHGDQRTGILGSLNHSHSKRHSCNDAIANRKILG